MPLPIINFSAGPSKIPDDVKNVMLREFMNYQNTGSNIFELSHRSEYFTKIVSKAKQSLTSIYDIPDTHEVMFMQGGATGQFAAIPLNLFKGLSSENLHCQRPDYLVTGQWSAKAAKEAKSLLGKENVNLVTPVDNIGLQAALLNDRSSLASGDSNYDDDEAYDFVLKKYLVRHINPHAKYFYYCSNETIEGFEINDEISPVSSNNFFDILEEAYKAKYDLESPHANSFKMPTIVCDMSSNMCTKPVDINRFGLIYGGAQKNIGIAGITVIIIRKDLISTSTAPQNIERPVPSVLDYGVVSKAGSLPNTPPVYSIYALELTLRWILNRGHLDLPPSTTTSPIAINEEMNGLKVNGDFCHMKDEHTYTNGHGGDSHCLNGYYQLTEVMVYWARMSQLKSQLIYSVIDASNGFYTLLCPGLNKPPIPLGDCATEVFKGAMIPYDKYRSHINLSFKITPTNNLIGSNFNAADLEKQFLEKAKIEHNMFYLKGHRSVGGIRASLFNSITLNETRRLSNFMLEFYKQHK